MDNFHNNRNMLSIFLRQGRASNFIKALKTLDNIQDICEGKSAFKWKLKNTTLEFDNSSQLIDALLAGYDEKVYNKDVFKECTSAYIDELQTRGQLSTLTEYLSTSSLQPSRATRTMIHLLPENLQEDAIKNVFKTVTQRNSSLASAFDKDFFEDFRAFGVLTSQTDTSHLFQSYTLHQEYETYLLQLGEVDEAVSKLSMANDTDSDRVKNILDGVMIYFASAEGITTLAESPEIADKFLPTLFQTTSHINTQEGHRLLQKLLDHSTQSYTDDFKEFSKSVNRVLLTPLATRFLPRTLITDAQALYKILSDDDPVALQAFIDDPARRLQRFDNCLSGTDKKPSSTITVTSSNLECYNLIQPFVQSSQTRLLRDIHTLADKSSIQYVRPDDTERLQLISKRCENLKKLLIKYQSNVSRSRLEQETFLLLTATPLLKESGEFLTKMSLPSGIDFDAQHSMRSSFTHLIIEDPHAKEAFLTRMRQQTPVFSIDLLLQSLCARLHTNTEIAHAEKEKIIIDVLEAFMYNLDIDQHAERTLQDTLLRICYSLTEFPQASERFHEILQEPTSAIQCSTSLLRAMLLTSSLPFSEACESLNKLTSLHTHDADGCSVFHHLRIWSSDDSRLDAFPEEYRHLLLEPAFDSQTPLENILMYRTQSSDLESSAYKAFIVNEVDLKTVEDEVLFLKGLSKVSTAELLPEFVEACTNKILTLETDVSEAVEFITSTHSFQESIHVNIINICSELHAKGHKIRFDRAEEFANDALNDFDYTLASIVYEPVEYLLKVTELFTKTFEGLDARYGSASRKASKALQAFPEFIDTQFEELREHAIENAEARNQVQKTVQVLESFHEIVQKSKDSYDQTDDIAIMLMNTGKLAREVYEASLTGHTRKQLVEAKEHIDSARSTRSRL